MELPTQMDRVYQDGLDTSKGKRILYEGIPENWKRSEEAKTFINVNPSESNINCVNCSIAYEMRRRGYMVEAGDELEALRKNPFSGWADPEIININPDDDSVNYICNALGLWGDGSRAQIAIVRGNYSAHSFCVEQINGAASFIDPQRGIVYNIDDVKEILKESRIIDFCRTDTQDISDLGISACKEAKNGFTDYRKKYSY